MHNRIVKTSEYLCLDVFIAIFNNQTNLILESQPSHGGPRRPEEGKPLDPGDPGHLRVRDLPEERLRAVLHQLCQREASADLHRAHPQSGTG